MNTETLSMTKLAARGYLSSSRIASFESKRSQQTVGRVGVGILRNSPLFCAALIKACRTCDFVYQEFSDTASMIEGASALSLKLAIVQQNACEVPLRTIVDSLRSAGFSRLVLVGPVLGSRDHIFGLDVGFDEVWQATMPFDLTCAVLHKSLLTAGRLAVNELPPTLGIGSLLIDQSNNSCTYKGHSLTLGRESFLLLCKLVADYPAATSRLELSRVAGRSCDANMVASKALNMAVARLRRRLAEVTNNTFSVRSVENVGYRLAILKEDAVEVHGNMGARGQEGETHTWQDKVPTLETARYPRISFPKFHIVLNDQGSMSSP